MQEFHETLHSLLLWLAHAESRRFAVDIRNPETPVRALQRHCNTLTVSTKRIYQRVEENKRIRCHFHLLCLWSTGAAEGAAGQASSAGVPPVSVVSAAAQRRGRGERRGPGEAPRNWQEAEPAPEGGGPRPQQPATASGN